MRCEAVQVALSAAMDGGANPSGRQLEHARSCPACSRFSDRAWRLREMVRFEVAPPVPDLVPSIVRQVREETRSPSVVRRLPTGARRQRTRWVPVPAVAAALALGLVVGYVLTSGGVVPRRGPLPSALAEQIPARLREAAFELPGYRATFEITELNWTRQVPHRTFRADLAFRPPESLRVELRDTTAYPGPQWPRNDLLLVTDGRSFRVTGPNPCPAAALPDCPQPVPVDRVVTGRAPFDPRTPAPTDVIVPMTVLAASDRADVLGEDLVAGSPTVVVELAYRDALPLFEYLRFLGSWRPYFPDDRVLVWLDRTTWFPLRYEVFPASGPERDLWAEQQGLVEEDPDRAAFVATATTLSERPPSPGWFDVARTGPAEDEGFRDRPVAGLDAVPEGETMQPLWAAGLQPWRFGSYRPDDSRPFRESILAYARGLSWLTVTRVSGWDQPGLFGVGSFAEPVVLPSERGVAYYEPASDSESRRLAVHTAGGELLLRTNLPRSTLLEVAASLPEPARPIPAAWQTRRWPGGVVEEGLTDEAAVSRVGFRALLPTYLPVGYEAVAGQVFRSRGADGVTIVYRRAAAELDGVGLRLSQAAGQTIPPPTRGDEQSVPVRGVVGRWSPGEHVLEWIEDGIYLSLAGPSFDLTALLQVAASLEPRGLERSSG